MIRFAKRFIVIFFVASPLLGIAQQEPQFSQNMFNILPVNAGIAGMNDAICANVLYRNQWTGFVGAPKTGLFNIEAPIKFPLIAGLGVGATLWTDKIGLSNQFGAKLALNFRFNVGPGQLGVGLQGGFLNQSLDGSLLNPFVSDGSDESIPASGVSAGAGTFGIGIMYKTDMFYAGISSTQLTESTLKYAGIAYNLKRHIYVTAGMTKRLNSTLEIKPSIWYNYDGAVAHQIDLNVLLMYNNQFWGGVSYRMLDVDALVPMIGIQWNNLKVGYSYDIMLQRLRGFSTGTHEIMIGYCFKVAEKVTAQKYRNVRFL
ncbi:MAG TPA: type IX secretion system membrane protein PorP/SprF [Flavobacteriales bacterium]|nr:type IX secretion system membrane protein PorP/SprF [Flavobacteriales bacterium]